ncbi:hypothetical protein [Novosphingobium sp. FKTRR1]|uniref:hypothetical protein n=1 Tax=Novosphingobium sp. FKTRR1 TaxID=2879118 RepID=UPI001CF0ACB7|nr:hypothetical protein [Novosphingobium sp. FKTRR1]
MKSRAAVAGLALFLAGIGASAHARPPEALACAIKAAPAGLDARLADVVVSRDNDRGRPALDELRRITEACATDQFLNEKQTDSYFSYALGRLARDVLDGRLAAHGLSAALIDKALDIGPGNANNPAEKVTQGDLNRVAQALREEGTDPAKVTPEGWGLVTAWIVATANMFDGLRTLD